MAALWPRLLSSLVGERCLRCPPHHLRQAFGLNPGEHRASMQLPRKLSGLTNLLFNRRNLDETISRCQRLKPGEISPRRPVPAHIQKPPYAKSGKLPGIANKPEVHDEQGIEFMRASGRLAAQSTRSNGRLCWFGGIEMAPADPIFGINEAFRSDTSERKLNLSVGVYRTEQLQPYVPNVVKKAEKLMLEKEEDKEYLPLEGLAEFNRLTAEVIFGADNPLLRQNKVATVQSLSGTISLRLSAAFIKRFFHDANVLISSPTWGHHKMILDEVAIPWSEYRYYDPNTIGLDIDGMIADIKGAPNGSFVLLQGCAHNPTGIDPTPEQWQKIADVIQEKNHIPFFDVAYQGFASGCLDADAYSVRLFVARGMEVAVTQTYSKNMGLYAERIGAVNMVCKSKEAATRVQSQLKWLASPMYASPGAHGARIVATIVGNNKLMHEWKVELKMMAERIKSVRQKLYDILTAKDNSGKDWSFILRQKGMFSYTGLNKSQCENMTRKWQVYMTNDGRISVATLSSMDCEYLADAIIDSLYNTSEE